MTDASVAAARPERPSLRVAVVMERETAPNRFEDWRFRVAEGVPHEDALRSEPRVLGDAFGRDPRVLRDDAKWCPTLFPGFTLELFRNQAEGYFLNLRTGAPVWF